MTFFLVVIGKVTVKRETTPSSKKKHRIIPLYHVFGLIIMILNFTCIALHSVMLWSCSVNITYL